MEKIIALPVRWSGPRVVGQQITPTYIMEVTSTIRSIAIEDFDRELLQKYRSLLGPAVKFRRTHFPKNVLFRGDWQHIIDSIDAADKYLMEVWESLSDRKSGLSPLQIWL
jgi:hypothetical protein